MFNRDKTELIQYPIGNIRDTYLIPDSVISIGNSAFRACGSLTSVIIPESVKNIGDYVFLACTSLTSIIIPCSVTNIGEHAFQNCFSLLSVTLDDNLTIIGNYAFQGCNSLTFIIIPDSVTSIGEAAFRACRGLTSITIPDSVTKIGNSAFQACPNLVDVYYLGSEEKWLGVSIGSANNSLLDATIHYNHSHIYSSSTTKEPTCTDTGVKTFTCECKKSYIEPIPELGHDIIIDEAVAATCTTTGLTAGQHCSRCNDVTIEQKPIPELGHDIIIDEAVAATCTTTGLTAGQHCSRCNDETVKQETIPVNPHEYNLKYDSDKHWKECSCGTKIEMQNHSFISGNICSCGYRRITNATLIIKNNSGSKTINYGETLKLTADVTNKPYDATIYWYVDGVLMGEGVIFNINFDSGTRVITAKLVDNNGNALQDADGNEIFDAEEVTVKSGFFQKLISFFKNLLGANRTVVQAIFKGTI